MNEKAPVSAPEASVEEIRVRPGRFVKVHFMEDAEGYNETYLIVQKPHMGETENGIQELNVSTALAKALNNRGIGDDADFPSPQGGDIIKVKIIDIY